jgi:hypothetical protein
MRGPINQVRDFLGAISDRIVVDGGNAVRWLGRTVGWPLKRVAWTFQDRVVWALQDRMPSPESRRRAIGIGGAVAAVAGAGVAGLLLAGSNGSEGSAATVASSQAPIVKVTRSEHEPAAPTLQGATPNFKAAAKDERSAADSSEPAEPTPTESATAGTGASSSAATDKISSAPTAEASSVASPPAGPAAIAVAHKFANAFVVYETGGVEAPVRDAFGETATPELSRALLRRPPRLPSGVEVPEAKILNVVPGPSRGPIYPVSVSLVRLGVTSELRLSMERDKNDEWLVSDVLG